MGENNKQLLDLVIKLENDIKNIESNYLNGDDIQNMLSVICTESSVLRATVHDKLKVIQSLEQDLYGLEKVVSSMILEIDTDKNVSMNSKRRVLLLKKDYLYVKDNLTKGGMYKANRNLLLIIRKILNKETFV